ncbi:MAG: tripartite tricarboxylate transporter TctB family protein [Streptomycetales bacterium]
MRRLNPDLVIAAVLTALGAAVAAGAVGYRIVGEDGGVGPGFMPFVAGLLLAAFATWAGAEIVRGSRRAAGRAAAGPLGEPPGNQQRRVVLVFVLTLTAILLTEVVGFLPAFGLLVLVLLLVVEREPAWLAVALTVGAVAFSWLVFVQILGVPLPEGVLHMLWRG